MYRSPGALVLNGINCLGMTYQLVIYEFTIHQITILFASELDILIDFYSIIPKEQVGTNSTLQSENICYG